MSKPTIFGFPIWTGNIKHRLVKKKLRRFRFDWLLSKEVQEAFAGYDIGSLINDCAGFNVPIVKMMPEYIRFSKGHILADIDFENPNGGSCSLALCGVQPKQPREIIERKTVEFLENWTLGDRGATWFGKDSDDHKLAVESANKKIQLIKSGGHITDDDGQLLPEFGSGLI